MSGRYKSTRRCYLIDHHSPQLEGVTLEHLDPEEYRSFFREANIDSLMVYCKDHWGVTYYDSRVPGAQKHRGVKGDWIQKIRAVTQEEQIEFIAYYCIEYDEGAARRFPQWRVRKADGSPLIRDDLYAKWSLCCYQTGYREYALSQLEEIVAGYHPDALFLDIFGASLCYCSHCKAKFLERFSYPLPETEEGLALHRKDVISFLDDNAEDFLLELRRRTKAIDPSLAITINFSCHYPKKIRDLLDYQFSEPLMKDNWYSAAYARDTAIGQSPILAPGEASQVYNYSSENQYLCELSAIAAQGCRVGMYSGSQHPDGTLDHLEASRLGAVYREHEKFAPYLDNRTPVRCVGILQSDSSKAVTSGPLYPDAILRMKRHNPHTYAILGAMELCEHEKLPCRILPESALDADALSGYDLLILPEMYVIPEMLIPLLTQYVRDGGHLMVSGKSGLWNPDGSIRSDFSISHLLGVHYKDTCTGYKANGWSAYLKQADGESFTGLLKDTTPPVSEFFMETTVETAHTCFYFQLPCVVCTENTWVNWWSPPPGPVSAFPALTEHTVGKGSVCYFAYDFFSMAADGNYSYVSSLFHQLCSRMLLQPEIQVITDTADILRTAYFNTQDGYLIHQLSVMAQTFHGNVLPVPGGTLKVQKPIRSAEIVYPEQKNLTVQASGEGFSIELPSFTMQQIILLRLEPDAKKEGT